MERTKEEYLKELIDNHISSLGEFTGNYYINFLNGIKTIDNIRAIAYLSFDYREDVDDSTGEKYLCCKLYVEISDVYGTQATHPVIGPKLKYLNYDVEACGIILKTVKELLKIVKFDKCKSRFNFDHIDTTCFVDFMTDDNPNVIKSYDTCCVCFENTTQQTNCCKVTLCIPCNMKIMAKPCELCVEFPSNHCISDKCMDRPCPYCREKLKLYGYECM